MTLKFCSRCHFAVSLKRRNCQICGNDTFTEPLVIEETESRPLAEAATAVGNAVKNFALGLAHDAKKARETSAPIAEFLPDNQGINDVASQ